MNDSQDGGIVVITRDLTQRQLAKATGVSENLISLLANRHRRASKATKTKLAQALGCSTEDLLVLGGTA